MPRPKILTTALILILGVLPLLPQSPPSPAATILARTEGMVKAPGYITTYWDERTGKIWFEIDRFDRPFLYYTGLPAGLGSNDIGLDRSQIGQSRVVRFQRIGPKILLVQSNLAFRADTAESDVRRNVEDSFVYSVIAGFEIAAEENGRVLVEATPFLLRDAVNAAEMIAASDQGQYRVDPARSAIHLPGTRNFPLNTEIEAIVTLSGGPAGRLLWNVAPDAGSLTFRMHHSLVALPDGDFQARPYDPRSNFMALSYMDFATPFSEPIEKAFVRRFRLKKKDPKAPLSEAVKPIVYYVDRGIPEPIRTAVIEGASWWNQAFTAAGYKDAFQVKLLPEGVDPMDIRYNVINWVNRSSRGWSYGGGVTDPRTGEILKAQATLGSLRIRQDYLIAESLVAGYEAGKDNSQAMRDMALSRIRHLSAHEVGHTLGMGHSFASSVNDRASVMDYPHPLVKIQNDGTLDLSGAYTAGIGEWDKVSIAFAYQDYPSDVDEIEAGRALLDKAFAAGLFFLSGEDSGPSGAQPLTAAWDNGRNLVDELERVIRIRSIALANFSERRIRPWRPLATLEEVLVPAYLFHRYQTEAAAASIGGLMYFHKLRGDVQKFPAIVPPPEQRRALEVILGTIRPEFLAIDERILRLIPPRPPDFSAAGELFPRKTGSTFDPLAAAETAAGLSIGLILNPARASRLVEYHARNPENPGLEEIIDKLLDATWRTPERNTLSPYHAEVGRVAEKVALSRLLGLASGDEASTQAGAIAALKIEELKGWLRNRLSSDAAADAGTRAHWAYGIGLIEEFKKDPKAFKPPAILSPPQGAPIG